MTLITWNDQAVPHPWPQSQDAATTTAIEGHQSHPLPFPVHRVKRPRRCAQARDTNCPIPNTRMPPPTDNLDGTRLRQQSEGTTSTPHIHHPPGPKALALCTSARCRSPNAQLRAPQPPTSTTARNCHRNLGEPTPPPSTTLHQAAMPRHRTQVHDVNCTR